jgi:hypothetical protein
MDSPAEDVTAEMDSPSEDVTCLDFESISLDLMTLSVIGSTCMELLYSVNCKEC